MNYQNVFVELTGITHRLPRLSARSLGAITCFILYCLGLVVCFSGAVLRSRLSIFYNFSTRGFTLGTSVLVLGYVIMVAGLLMFSGYLNDTRPITVWFFVIMLLTVGSESFLLYELIGRNEIIIELKARMASGVADYKRPGSDPITRSWDQVQGEFSCCGLNASSDWLACEAMEGLNLPDSCCKEVKPFCGLDGLRVGGGNARKFNVKGCFEQVNISLADDLFIVLLVVLMAMVIKIVVIIVSFFALRTPMDKYLDSSI